MGCGAVVAVAIQDIRMSPQATEKINRMITIAQASTLAFRFAPLPNTLVVDVVNRLADNIGPKLSKEEVKALNLINNTKGNKLLSEVVQQVASRVSTKLDSAQTLVAVEKVKNGGVLSGSKARTAKFYMGALIVPLGLVAMSAVSLAFAAFEPGIFSEGSLAIGVVFCALAFIISAALLLKTGKSYPGAIRAWKESRRALEEAFTSAVLEVANKAIP